MNLFRDIAPPPQLPLFVYGTLRSGEVNSKLYLQENTVSIQPATIRGELYWIPQEGYPYLLPGHSQVHGEVTHIAPDSWPTVILNVDRLEEYDAADETQSWYLRRTVEARLDDCTTILCWTYFWNRLRRGDLITSGDWHNR